jgi:hypothetical protein
MSENVISGKVDLSGYKSKASGWPKSAVPKLITGEIRWHIDCGTGF